MAAWLRPILVKKAGEIERGDTMLVYLPSGVHHYAVVNSKKANDGSGNVVIEFLSTDLMEFNPEAEVLVVP